MYRRRYILIFIRCTVTSLFGLMCLVCCLICCLVLRFFLPFDHRSTSCMYCPTYPHPALFTPFTPLTGHTSAQSLWSAGVQHLLLCTKGLVKLPPDGLLT